MRICDIVAYAHSRGVLHRDLKPSNVMLGKFGETLVVDWGLAKPIEPSQESRPAVRDELTLRPVSGSSVQATLHGATLGTPQYMSPEQAGQLDRVGRVSDVYGLGATLYCILTGFPPLYDINDVGPVLSRVARRYCPAAESQAGRAADARGCLQEGHGSAPEDRYQSVRGLEADIESWLADEPVQGVREPRLSPARDLGAQAPHVFSDQRSRAWLPLPWSRCSRLNGQRRARACRSAAAAGRHLEPNRGDSQAGS